MHELKYRRMVVNAAHKAQERTVNVDGVVMRLGKGTVLYGNRALAAAHMDTVRKRRHMMLRIRVKVHPGKGHIPTHLGQPTKAVQVIHRHLCHGKVAALGKKGACRLSAVVHRESDRLPDLIFLLPHGPHIKGARPGAAGAVQSKKRLVHLTEHRLPLVTHGAAAVLVVAHLPVILLGKGTLLKKDHAAAVHIKGLILRHSIADRVALLGGHLQFHIGGTGVTNGKIPQSDLPTPQYAQSADVAVEHKNGAVPVQGQLLFILQQNAKGLFRPLKAVCIAGVYQQTLAIVFVKMVLPLGKVQGVPRLHLAQGFRHPDGNILRQAKLRHFIDHNEPHK